MCCFQDSTWHLICWQTTENRITAVAFCCSLDDGSWAIISDSFSESDVGKRVDPEREEQWNKMYDPLHKKGQKKWVYHQFIFFKPRVRTIVTRKWSHGFMVPPAIMSRTSLSIKILTVIAYYWWNPPFVSHAKTLNCFKLPGWGGWWRDQFWGDL